MLDAKRVFVSLGTGLFMSISLIAIMLTSKILNGPEWISMVILWIFFWPIWLFVYVIPAPGRVGAAVLALSIGLITDIAIFSALTYAELSLLKRKSRRGSPPPPPHFQ